MIGYATGFNYPKYKWEFNGEWHSRVVQGEAIQEDIMQDPVLDNAGSSLPLFWFTDASEQTIWLKLSDVQVPESLPETKLKFSVSELNIPSSTSYSDQYVIHWHQPTEGWTKRSADSIDEVITAASSSTLSSTLAYDLPTSDVEYDYKDGVKRGTAYLDLGISIIKILPYASDAINLAGLFKAALNAAVAPMESPPGPQQDYIPIDYAHYKTDILFLAGMGQQDPNCEPEIRGLTPEQLTTFTKDADEHDAKDNAEWQTSNWSVVGEAHYKKWHENWLCDTYDEHGFAGLAPSTLDHRTSLWTKRIWTWSGTPSGTPTPGP